MSVGEAKGQEVPSGQPPTVPAQPWLIRMFRAFQYPEFRVMWIGACISSVGTWMQMLAQSWLVLKLSNSSGYLGLDAFFGQIPIFLFSLVGGVFADRKSRRKLLIISQLVQMTCAFLLAALVATETVRVWHIWCLSFTVGVAQSFGGPAYQALVPMLVGKEDLRNAIALNSIQFNLARIVGPMLGLIAFSKLGFTGCFALNGISYIAVIITLLMVTSRKTPDQAAGSVIDSMQEGIQFIRNREGMSSLVVMAFLLTLLSYPLITFLPVMARDVFHGGPDILTLLLSLTGAGSVVGALLLAAEQRHAGQAKRALLVMAALGVLIAGFGLSRNVVLSAFLVFCSGSALMIVFAANASLVQLLVSDTMRGRVMSVYNVAFRGGMPFGSVVSGFMIERTSAPTVMVANGVLVFLLALYYLLVQRRMSKL